MAVRFKQLCYSCKKNYVELTPRQRFAICYDCQKPELDKEIKDKEMKKLFNIPEEFYKENSFLRNIKVAYLRYQNLSEKQVEAFKKTVKRLKEESTSTNRSPN